MSIRKKIAFSPDNAMNGLARGASNGANRIGFGSFFCVAIIAFGFALLRVSFGNRLNFGLLPFLSLALAR